MHSLDLLQRLGMWSIEGLWMPLLAWTVLAGLVWGCLRLWRSAPPLVSYAVLTSLLLALPLGVLLGFFTDVSLIAIQPPSPSSITLPALPQSLAPPLVIVDTTVPVFSWTLLHSLGVLLLVAGLTASVACFRFALYSYRLAQLRRHLPTTDVNTDALQILNAQIDTLGLHRPVCLIVTSHAVVPLTFGWRHPVIVIPASLLDDAEALRLTLLHELVHIRRGDYLMQWIGNAVGALFAVHPMVWFLRRKIADYRELACDAAVLGQPHISSKRYATLLYQFALVRSEPPQLALSMAASHRELKTRITAMKSHKTAVHRFSPRLVATTLASLLLGLATLVVACTDFVGPDLEAETVAAKTDSSKVYVVAEEMPVLVGGLDAIQQEIQYPKIAKMAGIEGRVFLQFTVDAQGKVVNPEVVKGIGAGCDEEALRALQTATFKPGKQAGETIPVKMSIPVTFRLDGGHSNPSQKESSFGVMQKQPERLKAEKSTPPPPAPSTNEIEIPATQPKTSTLSRRPPPPPSSTSDLSSNQIRVTSDGDVLEQGIDFTVNWVDSTVSIVNPSYLSAYREIEIEY